MSLTSTKATIATLLDPEHSHTRSSSAINYFLIGLIIANVVAISLQTVASLDARFHAEFLAFEIFSVAVFTVEFLLRVWTVPESVRHSSRHRFLGSFDSIVDIVSIAPLYLSLFFGVDIRALIALRMLRLLKLVRYFSPLILLGQVIKAEARAFIAAIFVLLILVFIAASGIYFFESDVQPEAFGSIPEAMWWATVTLTTLGYGDVVPVTNAGKMFAGVMTILSIGTVALPAGMLASRFSDELHRRKRSYQNIVAELNADGDLDEKDRESLARARESLNISEADAADIESQAQHGAICPHCNGTGKTI